MDQCKDKYDFSIRWKPFLLRDMPEEGKVKPPNTPDNPRVNPRMWQAGNAVGVNFTGLCDVYPNTVRAHVLLFHAAKILPEKQDELADKIFYGYYTAGQNPNQEETLMQYAKEVGLEEKSTKAQFSDPIVRKEVLAEVMAARQSGVSGVPYFFMNGKPYFSGMFSLLFSAAAFALSLQGYLSLEMIDLTVYPSSDYHAHNTQIHKDTTLTHTAYVKVLKTLQRSLTPSKTLPKESSSDSANADRARVR